MSAAPVAPGRGGHLTQIPVLIGPSCTTIHAKESTKQPTRTNLARGRMGTLPPPHSTVSNKRSNPPQNPRPRPLHNNNLPPWILLTAPSTSLGPVAAVSPANTTGNRTGAPDDVYTDPDADTVYSLGVVGFLCWVGG